MSSRFTFVGLGPKKNFSDLFTGLAEGESTPPLSDDLIAAFEVDKNGHGLSYVFVAPEELPERLAAAQGDDYKQHQVAALRAAVNEARVRALIPA
jgi:hypothetical protein